MTSGSKSTVWPAVCAGPTWLCLCIESFSYFFPPFPMGLRSDSRRNTGGKTNSNLCTHFHPIPETVTFLARRPRTLSYKLFPGFSCRTVTRLSQPCQLRGHCWETDHTPQVTAYQRLQSHSGFINDQQKCPCPQHVRKC